MLTVGITGGLATGKSAVTSLLQTCGATVFSADEAARTVLIPGGETVRRIVRAFGPAAQHEDGSLNRPYLAAQIFSDKQAREALERVIHPPILRLLRAQLEACAVDLPACTVVAVEVPLLFETKLQGWFERIVVVTASEEVQVNRLAARNHLPEAEARQRIATQMPLQAKMALADYLVTNDGGLDSLRPEVTHLWQKLLVSSQETKKH